MAKDESPAFGDGFLWGASTSAHQVEGGNHNQWTVWEEANAGRLAATAQERLGFLPNWSNIKARAEDPANYISDNAVDHYHHYLEDFKLLDKIGLNAFRFGVEWSRIEPIEGQFNQDAINHYKRYIAELKGHGVQPVINLWHWTLPVWFEDMGGFSKKKNIHYFERFVQKIAQDLIIPCRVVIIINEANSYVGMSYLEGEWPPKQKNIFKAFKVYANLASAHKQVYKMLKTREPNLIIGSAHQCNNNQPKRRHSPLDRLVAASASYGWNWWWLNRIKNHQDFVGFNYYFTDYFKGVFRKNPTHHNKTHRTNQRGLHRRRRHNPPGPLNDLGWYMEPSGMYRVIMQIAKRYNKPIIVTETGVADEQDQYRQWWLEETIKATERANQEGANVVGYFYWSLLDNFEWSTGWWPKFGLVSVDREHDMKRVLKPSVDWLAKFIKST